MVCVSADQRYRSVYGISEGRVREMLAAQDGRCAICRTEIGLDDAAVRACVDHCHRTWWIRGMLCSRCNSGLGFFRDDPELLRGAAAYLEREPPEVVDADPACTTVVGHPSSEGASLLEEVRREGEEKRAALAASALMVEVTAMVGTRPTPRADLANADLWATESGERVSINSPEYLARLDEPEVAYEVARYLRTRQVLAGRKPLPKPPTVPNPITDDAEFERRLAAVDANRKKKGRRRR